MVFMLCLIYVWLQAESGVAAVKAKNKAAAVFVSCLRMLEILAPIENCPAQILKLPF